MTDAVAGPRTGQGFSTSNANNGTYPEELFRPYECANPECQATDATFTEGIDLRLTPAT